MVRMVTPSSSVISIHFTSLSISSLVHHIKSSLHTGDHIRAFTRSTYTLLSTSRTLLYTQSPSSKTSINTSCLHTECLSSQRVKDSQTDPRSWTMSPRSSPSARSSLQQPRKPVLPDRTVPTESSTRRRHWYRTSKRDRREMVTAHVHVLDHGT